MDLAIKPVALLSKLKKYRYSILILLLGFVLLSFPSLGKESEKKQEKQTNTTNEITLEEKLSKTLSQMYGAGKVEVLLTRSAGEEIIYQTDQDSNIDDTRKTIKNSTVTTSDSNRNQTGLIRQINPERYQGAIVLCQGASDPNICLAIVDAISKATGLGANNISILEMN